MKMTILPAALLFAAAATATPATAATPASPGAQNFPVLGTAPGEALQVRHLRRNSPTCRRWRVQANRGNRRANLNYRRHCVGGPRVSRDRCARWRQLARTNRGYRALYQRHCSQARRPGVDRRGPGAHRGRGPAVNPRNRRCDAWRAQARRGNRNARIMFRRHCR